MNTTISSKYRMVWDTLHELHDYSGVLVSLVVDHYLRIPALSYVDEGGLPTIRINLALVPLCESVIAHVMAHEYGHHVMKHVHTELYKLTPEELDSREDEADTYAAKFVHDRKYALAPIELFISQLAPVKKIAERRLNLLAEFSK